MHISPSVVCCRSGDIANTVHPQRKLQERPPNSRIHGGSHHGPREQEMDVVPWITIFRSLMKWQRIVSPFSSMSVTMSADIPQPVNSSCFHLDHHPTPNWNILDHPDEDSPSPGVTSQLEQLAMPNRKYDQIGRI